MRVDEGIVEQSSDDVSPPQYCSLLVRRRNQCFGGAMSCSFYHRISNHGNMFDSLIRSPILRTMLSDPCHDIGADGQTFSEPPFLESSRPHSKTGFENIESAVRSKQTHPRSTTTTAAVNTNEVPTMLPTRQCLELRVSKISRLKTSR